VVILVYERCPHKNGKQKWSDYTKPLNETLDALKKGKISNRDVVKGGVAFGVGVLARSKLIGSLTRMYTTIATKVTEFIKNNPLATLQEYMATPDGSLLKILYKTNGTTQSSKNNVGEKSLDTPMSNQSILQFVHEKITAPWVSKAGLIYGVDRKFGTRINHVLQHTKPNSQKIKHTIFTLNGTELFDLIDFAWLKRGHHVPGDPGAYIIELGRIIGTLGETAIKIVVNPGTTELLSAYPVKA
jgi:hypothetical protein